MLMPSSVSSSPAVKIKGGGVAATTPSSTINPPPIGGGRHYFSTLLRQMDQEKVLSKIEEGTANGKTTNNIVGDDGGENVKTQTKGITHKIRVILPHVLLFLSTILYGLFGALVFQRLERPFEVLHLQEHTEAIIKAQNELFVFPNSSQKISNISENVEIEEEILIEKAIDNLIKLYMEAFEQGIRADELAIAIEDFNSKNNLKNLEEEENNLLLHRRLPKWHFHSSLFFTATLLTSIGYGNLVPISPFGRLFCICYAFLGIPLTLITIADVAKYLSDLILNIGNWLEKKFEGKKKKNERKEEENEIKNKNNSSPIIKINEENGGEKERKNEEEEEEEETGGILRQPGPYTKGFVLFLLFGYMMTMAFLFWHVQPDWGLLESIYFTLITLVTIGFGDFCPTLEGNYSFNNSNNLNNITPTTTTAFGWILFIFVGLTLSTLTVDMVGYSYIERIHTLGRGFHLGSLLTMLKLGRGDAGPDSARLLRQLHAGAFIPADLKLIPYIDQLLSQRPSIETVLFDNGSGQKSGFSFLPDPTKGKDDFGNRNARNRKRNTGIFV